MALSADGGVVAVATIYEGLKVYDAAGRLLWFWGGGSAGCVTSVEVSDDGNAVVAALHTGDYADYILFWKNAESLSGNPQPDWNSSNLYGRIGAEALAVSSDGKQVVAVGTGLNIFYWNDTFTLSGNNVLATWSDYLYPYTLEYVDISDDGNIIAILGFKDGKKYDVSAFVYNVCKSRVGNLWEDYNLSYNFGSVVNYGGIALSENGLYVVASVGGGSIGEEGKIYLFNTSMSELWAPQWICRLKEYEWAAAVEISGDGNTIAAVTNSYVASPSRLTIFHDANSKTGVIAADGEFNEGHFYTDYDYADVSLDGLGRVAVAGTGDHVFAINASTGELLWRFNGTYPCVSCTVKVSKDGNFAVTAGKYLDSVYFFRLGDYIWTETIVIEADGSVTPAGAPISTADSITYTLTSNIINAAPSNNDNAISIKRSNIVLDGSGYSLQGTNGDQSKGISLTFGISNVTIKNMTIKQFYYGISLYENCLHNTISGNIIVNNSRCGVGLYTSSSCNIIYGNLLTNNTRGIILGMNCNNNSILENNIDNNDYGVQLDRSLYNAISQNKITNNKYGLYLSSSSNNGFYHNNLVNNPSHVVISNSAYNLWDDGYPSGGNYWSDYLQNYPEAEELDGSGLWDTPYVIDENNQDRYP
ncbi:MAG: NosD domain-containing protein, partial [Candidatus Bathyarchaeia archaeon]